MTMPQYTDRKHPRVDIAISRFGIQGGMYAGQGSQHARAGVTAVGLSAVDTTTNIMRCPM